MGNCCKRCLGRVDSRRKYLRSRYNVERDFSIEFENLMDDDAVQEEMNKVITAREKLLVERKEYGTLIKELEEQAAAKDAELVNQEEELRREEEAYFEAKREAARVAKLQKLREAKAQAAGNPNAWLGDEAEWELAGGDEDFEMFLESVKARSLAARTRGIASQVPVDAQSTASGSSVPPEKADDHDASSLDLEWDHEAAKKN